MRIRPKLNAKILFNAYLCAFIPMTAAYAEPSLIPDSKTINKIEVKLSKSSCIGNIDKWSRHYRFVYRDGKINTNIIVADYKEEGLDGIPAGEYREYSKKNVFSIDERKYKNAFALYDKERDKITWFRCRIANAD